MIYMKEMKESLSGQDNHYAFMNLILGKDPGLFYIKNLFIEELACKGKRLGRDNVDALSCLPLLNNGYYRDLLGEDGAFLQLQIGLTVYTKMLGLDLSWRATTKKALCAKHNVSLLIVPGAKTLGEWASLCKIDSEGKARKVIGCSCSCATLTTSLHKLRLGFFLLQLLKYHEAGRKKEYLPQVGQWNVMNKYPPFYKDMSFWISESFIENNLCKSYEKAKKKMTVLEAPNVLTIALKRFQSGKFGKLNKPIRFPEILDLASFMSGTSDLPIYRLHGVVVHLDIMSASFLGHYVCYVKNFQSSWFKVDDSVAISFPDFFLVDILTSMAKVCFLLYNIFLLEKSVSSYSMLIFIIKYYKF
ncbi:Ubiquitin carboxyl-terminal hydrolase 16 isoform D [Glycine soja]|uniref:40S ribosomal protein S12 n=1 Tax=Glycine soja TaxID=3848 RepID=A0A445LR88_GLYSO|nr:Ubiquitin carboxyl-terminal hydrolase 16 isoform D [Glycine soja]